MENKYSPIYFERDIVPEKSTLGETIGASVGYTLNPFFETVGQTVRYGIQRESGYVPYNDMQGYELYASDLARATNREHMAEIKRTIDASIKRREIMSNASLGNQLVAGFLDPVNALALPFGGPTVGIAKSMVRVGGGVGAIEAGLEATVRQFDPVQTAEEAALNIITSSIFGAGVGGVFAAPATAQARAWSNTQKAVEAEFQMIRRLENLEGLSREDIQTAPPREERRHGNLSDEEIAETIRVFDAEADLMDRQAASRFNTPEQQDYIDRGVELREYSRTYKNELAFRELESLGVDLKDPFNIAPSFFTESPLFKMVSTPMKRALQSKYPSSVKETFVRTFSDSGLALSLNSLGLPTPQSVYQRAAVSNGRWVASHQELINLWASDTNASSVTRLDISPSNISRRVQRSPDTYENWLVSVNEKRIKNISDLTENEIKAVEVINRYFTDAERKLEDAGLIGTSKGVARRIELLEAKIADLNTRLSVAELKKTNRGQEEARLTKARLDVLGNRLANEKQTQLALQEVKVNPDNEDIFFPRFWDQGAIRNRRQEFSDILHKWYKQNPYIYEMNTETAMFERKPLSTDPVKIQERVDLTIDRILGETDPTNVDNIGFGYGRSKHFRHRQIDIPNKLVTDFIVTNPLSVMKTYAARIEPRYEFARAFGDDVEGVLFDMETEMIRKGSSVEDINRMRRDYMHMYDRVAGTVLRNPDTLSQKAAFILREAASLNYMGSAGLAALPDFGRIVMEYDLENVIKGTQALMDQNMVNMTVDEIRLAGEAIDILRGSSHLRMVEDLGNNVDAGQLLNSARNAFYILNGLAPFTTIAKQLSGIVDAHQIIDYSIRYGELTDQELTWMARYGIGKEQAEKIARAPWQKTKNNLYVANTEQWLDSFYIPEVDGKRIDVIEINEDGTPVGKKRGDRYIPAFYRDEEKTIYFDRDYIEGQMFNEKSWLDPKMEGVDALPDIFKTPKQWSNFVMLHEVMHSRSRIKDGETTAAYENRINKMALEEYKSQQTINEETVQTFRSALNSGVLNTIMSGTPADKPIITDGVAYIPMRIARQFGMKEDAKVRGYARIENGFMGLPFQFYSYVLANVNKTVGALAQGQVKNRMIGISTSIGLAYLSLSLRTPSYVWDEMSPQDRFARSFDMSGVMALYSDLFYTSMHTSLALGGPNITGGLLSPKFPQEPSALDAITGIAGAGPSWLSDMSMGMYQFADGQYAEGGKQIVRNLPFARLWFLKDDINQITHAWAQ